MGKTSPPTPAPMPIPILDPVDKGDGGGEVCVVTENVCWEAEEVRTGDAFGVTEAAEESSASYSILISPSYWMEHRLQPTIVIVMGYVFADVVAD